MGSQRHNASANSLILQEKCNSLGARGMPWKWRFAALMRANGSSYREIGEYLNASGEYCRQLLNNAPGARGILNQALLANSREYSNSCERMLVERIEREITRKLLRKG